MQFSPAIVNCTSIALAHENKWLFDFLASHNIIGDLSNISIHSKYDGTNEIVISDGSGLQVSHIGYLIIHSPQRTFCLNDTL